MTRRRGGAVAGLAVVGGVALLLFVVVPVVVNVSEPKFTLSPAALPRSMLVPVRFALLVTLTLADAALVMSLVEVSARL